MYIADLHIHSRYSRATSKECTPEYLDLWARRKGIHIVGSGDFTHPAWREELKEKLEPAEEGLYKLKKEYRIEDAAAACTVEPRFVITGEISSIYKKNGSVRKVHSLILLPGLEEAELISEKLEAIGNIHSDGRPILGLDCRDLLEIILELCPYAVYVPAHIWTPHFSLFGAFSGFDSVEECFEDLSSHIHAMETGLSSDPPMNWRVSALDRYQLISNSDAHSPAKLGREANLMDIELSYRGIERAIQTGQGLYGTIEFFPEEGKYHLDGHRKCNLCLNPAETEKYGGICPVCGRKITIGVYHRIEQLADRAEGYVREQAAGFESLVPLPEVIGASVGYSSASVKVQREYLHMLQKLGPEFEILRNIPLEEIRSTSGQLISEGIGRLRQGQVERISGFDGEYGTIRLFDANEMQQTDGQMSFLETIGAKPDEKSARGKPAGTSHRNSELSEKAKKGEKEEKEEIDTADESRTQEPADTFVMNEEQNQAVLATERRIAVCAGPGTGKTRTLVSHILYLLETRKVKAGEITAVTFTNQAAAEMRERIRKQLGRRRQIQRMQIGTFHSICLQFLKDQGMEFTLADETVTAQLAAETIKEQKLGCTPRKFLEFVSLKKSGVSENENGIFEETKWQQAFKTYEERLRSGNLLDFDDLLTETLQKIENQTASSGWQKSFSYLMVDEFQDMNPLQYRLVKAWNEMGRELFVIGDPDQSIYGFRGADAACFTRLKQEFPDLKEITLVHNYRSGPQILSAAVEVISENPGGKRILNPICEEGRNVRLAQAGSEMGEAIFTAKEINRLTGGIGMLEAQQISEEGTERKVWGFDDIAVLYRTHRQAELLEKCLKKEGIPYIVAGREDFLTEDVVRGSLCFFRCLGDPEDDYSRQECMRLLWSLEDNLVAGKVYETMFEKYAPVYAKKKPQKFLEMWMEDQQLIKDDSMNKLAGMAAFHKSMPEFLEALSLGVESDLKRCGGKKYTSGAVTLMTLHGSKGLEFPAVILYGARKGTIPFESEKYKADTQEERRLFYVGMTRAKEELILTCSGGESEFLKELSRDLLSREKADGRKREESGHQMNLFELF